LSAKIEMLEQQLGGQNQARKQKPLQKD